MKLKENLTTTLLLTMGLLLHYIVPPVILGMKFDFLLIFMFISVFINPDRKNIVLTSFLAAIISAMTTTFPAGQLPNIIDKLATGLLLFILINIFNKKFNKITVPIMAFICTFFSGFVFLLVAKYVIGAEMDIINLVKFIVTPTAIINCFGTLFVHRMVVRALKIQDIH